ncbi:MAG: hypothetical protein JWN75_817 [Candidatus Saccharibacteria bacterium]|nr:hypothetical protein [Candidatus Saccharibacteria bacterium]
MLFQKKIPCYVLIFDQVDIIKKSLNFLSSHANSLDIIVIENPSNNSPKIKKIVDKLGKEGLIKRHYLMDKNVTSAAVKTVLDEEKSYILKHKYILLTDGDITVDDSHWLQEQRKILSRNREVLACGVSLDMSNLPLSTFPEANNWIPPDINVKRDYFEALTGGHLVLVRSKILFTYTDWLSKNDLSFVDGNFHKYCYEVVGKKWARTKKAKAYHLTWDLYADLSHPYTKFKLSKSFHDTWHHGLVSDFSLTQY